MKTIIAFTTSLLMLISLNATAHHSEKNKYEHQKRPTAYRCFDVEDRSIEGIWDRRDAKLINRVGGSCIERGPDEGDLHLLKQQSLSKRDIKKALRKARKRFPELLNDAWLVGAYGVNNSSLKHVRYKLIYDNLTTGQRIRVKVKQNLWSGKVKKMRAVVIDNQRPYYNS